MQVPNKIKNLIWRDCQNSLLTKENLLLQTIIDNPVCDRCKLVPESTIPYLWSYRELDAVWDNAPFWNSRQTIIDFKELLSWLITNQHHLELFLVMAWSVWTQRNQICSKKPTNNSYSIASLAAEYLFEFKAVQRLAPPTCSAPSLTRSRGSVHCMVW